MSETPVNAILAADIGGTHMRAALVSVDGEVLTKKVAPTPHDDQAPGKLTELIVSVCREVKAFDCTVNEVVIGLPGQVDYRAGQLLWAPHLPKSWPVQLSERHLGEVIGLPVHLANDADVAAVGEAYFGAGKDNGDVAYVTISTGIGAGLVFGGRLVHGDRSLGELGHTVVDWESWQYRQPAALEELASGSGIARLAAVAGLAASTAEDINALDQSGDPEAVRIWLGAIACAAVGIYNLQMLFAPSIGVIGGGLGLQPGFFAGVRDTLVRRATQTLPALPLVPAALGDSAGIVGAARWLEATRAPSS